MLPMDVCMLSGEVSSQYRIHDVSGWGFLFYFFVLFTKSAIISCWCDQEDQTDFDHLSAIP